MHHWMLGTNTFSNLLKAFVSNAPAELHVTFTSITDAAAVLSGVKFVQENFPVFSKLKSHAMHVHQICVTRTIAKLHKNQNLTTTQNKNQCWMANETTFCDKKININVCFCNSIWKLEAIKSHMTHQKCWFTVGLAQHWDHLHDSVELVEQDKSRMKRCKIWWVSMCYLTQRVGLAARRKWPTGHSVWNLSLQNGSEQSVLKCLQVLCNPVFHVFCLCIGWFGTVARTCVLAFPSTPKTDICVHIFRCHFTQSSRVTWRLTVGEAESSELGNFWLVLVRLETSSQILINLLASHWTT